MTTIMIEPFITPFTLPFMATALTTLLVVVVAAAPTATIVHLRGMQFAADALTHAVFPGLVIGMVAAGEPGLLPGALAAAVIASVVITVGAARRPAHADTIIAVVLSSAFGVGLLLLSRPVNTGTAPLETLLFGRVLAMPSETAAAITVAMLLVLAVSLVTWRAQVMTAFDPVGARAMGVGTPAVQFVFGAQLAMLAVAASVTMGTLLAVAIMILPVAAARLLTAQLRVLPWLTALIGAVIGWLGLGLNFSLSVGTGLRLPGGGTVVLTALAVYLLCVAAAQLRNAVSTLRSRRSAGLEPTAVADHTSREVAA